MTFPTKPYLLTFEVRRKYLYTHVSSATITPEIVIDYLHEMIGKCRDMRRKRLLIERDIPATLSDTELFFTGTEFAHMGIEDIRIAFVDARAENTERMEFAMLIANNRGANLGLFSTVADAETWLLHV